MSRLPARRAAGAGGLLAIALLAGCTSGGASAAPQSSSSSASPASPASSGPAGPAAASPTGATAGSSATAGATGTGPAAPPPAPLPTTTRATLAVAPAEKAVDVGGRAHATLVSARTVTVTGRGPGELSGPAVALTLRVVNGPAHALDLTAVTVTASVAGQEASPSDSPPAQPFRGSLAAARSATGVYVFVLPAGRHGTVAAVVSLSPDLPVARFTVRA